MVDLTTLVRYLDTKQELLHQWNEFQKPDKSMPFITIHITYTPEGGETEILDSYLSPSPRVQEGVVCPMTSEYLERWLGERGVCITVNDLGGMNFVRVMTENANAAP